MAEHNIYADLPFCVLKWLGEGGFGTAYLIQDSNLGVVAFKKILMSSNNEDSVEHLRREADIHKKLCHPNVVILYDSLVTPDVCGLFLEYMKYGPVDEFLMKFTVSWQWKLQIIHDVTRGMCYLQHQVPPIIHGDLKCQNILIGEGYQAKISDFGLARTFQNSGTVADHSIGGTIRYIAPEYLRDPFKIKDEKYDVYGFAISVWEILSEKPAYHDFVMKKLVAHYVKRGERPLISDIHENIPWSVNSLVEDCWHQDIEKRPTFARVKCILDVEMASINKSEIKQSYVSLVNQDPNYSPSNIHTPEPVTAVVPTEKKSFIELMSSIGIELCITRFKTVRNSLVRFLDPDNGLLLCLNDKEVLKDEDLEKLDEFKSTKAKSFIELNDELLRKYITPKIQTCCKEFLVALKENYQRHIALYIMHGGINLEDDERILTKEEISIINDNMFSLVNLINPYRLNFIYRLVSKKCITDEHKVSIEKWTDNGKKNDELLNILKRRSYKDFCNFKLSLHETMQKNIIDILKMGGMVAVCVTLQDREDRQIIESKLIDLVTGFVDECTGIDRNLTPEQISIIKDILKGLEASDIRLIGNCAWKSMAVFFQCSTEDSFEMLLRLYESGCLKNTLERVFQCLLDLSDTASKLIQDVAIVKYSARNGSSKAKHRHTDKQTSSSSVEIIHQNMIKCCMCIRQYRDPRILPCCHTFCLECLEGSGSNKQHGDKMLCPSCRKEFEIPPEGLEGIPKNLFMEEIMELQRSSTMDMMCDSCLDDDSVVEIMCIDCSEKLCEQCSECHMKGEATKLHQLISLKDEEDLLNQLKKNLTTRFCNSHKKPLTTYCVACRLIVCVMCCVENHQGHECIDTNNIEDKILEKTFEFMSMKEKELVGLEKQNKLNLDKAKKLQARVLEQAENIKRLVDEHAKLLVSEIEKYKIEKEEEIKNLKEEINRQITRLNNYERYATELKERDSTEKLQKAKELFNELHKCLNIFKDSSSVPRDFVISVIFTPPNLKFGRVSTIDENVIHNVMDVHLVAKYETKGAAKGIVGLTWLENKIYVLSGGGKRIHVFPDQNLFNCKEEIIEIDEIKDPRDMVASKHSRSIFISDQGNHCLWKIQIPGKETTRHEVDGKLREMSVSSTNELIVVTKRLYQSGETEDEGYDNDEKRFHLDIYRSSDVSMVNSITLPASIDHLYHAVRMSNENFIISYNDRQFQDQDQDLYLISEFSLDGKNIIRTFNPGWSVGNIQFKCWWCPMYLSVDENDNILIADLTGGRVLMLNSQLTDPQVLLNKTQHEINRPIRIHYLPAKQQIIVGQGFQQDSTPTVFVFNLHSRQRMQIQ